MDPSPVILNDEDRKHEDFGLLRNPTTLSYQSDGLRRFIISAYWTVIILALPLWWYTTSIERLSLPSGRVHQLAQNHLKLPIRICVETHDVSFIQSVKERLRIRISQDPQRWRGLEVNIIGKPNCEEMSESGAYSVVLQSGAPSVQDRRLYFPLNEPNSTDKLVDNLSLLIAPYTGSSDPEYRVAQYSPRYRLAFSLLNEDASAGGAVLDWGIQKEFKAHIYPITRRLAALHNFTIESQVQYHAPLAFSPLPLDGLYGITPEDLSVFVNSAEWTLSSSSSNDPVLHFILFIPSKHRRPLKILTNDGTPSLSSAFLLPQWGGIVIYNPISNISSNADLSSQDLQAIFSLFSNQLLALLGVPTLPAKVINLAPHVSVLSDWQLDALVRRRTFENARASQDTLLSIINLVDQIENMPVHQDVRGDVEDALYSLAKVYESATSALYQTFTYSAESFDLASRAFFNPGMLALLYFPAEHKYAVYTPLFASAIIPLFVAALRELIAYRRERKLT